MSSRARIVCYYDVVSPYSYYGVNLMNRYKTQAQWKDVDVVFRPIFLPALMSGAKNPPPVTVPAKSAYMRADLNRIGTASGIPFKFPSNFPAMTVLPMRVLIAIQKQESSAKYDQCIEKNEYWVQDKNITDTATLISALSPILGSDARVEELIQMASSKEIKQELIDNTQEAMDAGGFGAPLFMVKKAGAVADDKEIMFFGSDRFELMASILDLPYLGLAPKNIMASKL
ncbi:Glutathione S-transferase kappa 1 [Mortierella claussenii]|nr:Glutathione S-transferase kappa 1 [Mortierella claussenii]